jgi:pimeloyl-ACP methyl ester carboxylesterase
MQVVSVNGKQLCVNYLKADSSKPTIFFIHGLGSAAKYYEEVVTHLGIQVNVLLMDTEGAGGSPLSATRPSVDTIATDVVAVLDHFGIERAMIVGHSMGGMIACRIAEKHPRRVDGLVLIGPVHPTEKLASVFNDRIQKIRDTRSIQFLIDTVPTVAVGKKATDTHRKKVSQLISMSSPEGYIANCRVIAEAGQSLTDYKQIKQPTVVIVGSDDKTAPYEGCTGVIITSIGGPVTVETLEGVGHWHCVEDPAAIADIISKALRARD